LRNSKENRKNYVNNSSIISSSNSWTGGRGSRYESGGPSKPSQVQRWFLIYSILQRFFGSTFKIWLIKSCASILLLIIKFL